MKKITAKWYEKNYVPWIKNITSYPTLLKFHDTRNPRYKRRFDFWFNSLAVDGSVLELGFNNGKTLRWLGERYGDRVFLHGIDFNPALKKIVRYIKLLPRVRSLKIGNVLTHKGKYDHVMALDFIEHLYHADYLKLIKKINTWLVKGGRCYVFAGYSAIPEHVNILSTEQVIDDFKAEGFRVVHRLAHGETGDTMIVFEK